MQNSWERTFCYLCFGFYTRGAREGNSGIKSVSQELCNMFRNQNHIHSDKLNELILSQEESKSSEGKLTWNNDDRSSNTCVKSNGIIFYREPIAYYTDAIRGRVFFKNKINVWRIKWPRDERGTHAMVGVATDQMPLQAPGYVQLVGSDSHSWGFDLVNKSLHHNGRTTNCAYPDSGPDLIGDEITVVLDMDSGTLCFSSEDGHCYGIAFSNLKDKKLYPAISSVWGQCNVAIHFLGSISSQPPSLMACCRWTILKATKTDRTNRTSRHFHNSLPTKLLEYIDQK